MYSIEQRARTQFRSIEIDRNRGRRNTAEVKAHWTYQDGQVVNESTQTIAPTGDAKTEFHISKPEGWPPGQVQARGLLERVVRCHEGL